MLNLNEWRWRNTWNTLKTAVTSQNVVHVQTMIADDPHYTYSTIQRTLVIGFTAVLINLYADQESCLSLGTTPYNGITKAWTYETHHVKSEDVRKRQSSDYFQNCNEDDTCIPFYDTPTLWEFCVYGFIKMIENGQFQKSNASWKIVMLSLLEMHR